MNNEKAALKEDVNDEMAVYKESLTMLVSKMDYCDWDCVKNCSDLAIAVTEKSKCLDICACYDEAKAEKKEKNTIPFDFQKYMDPKKNAFNPAMSLVSVKYLI